MSKRPATPEASHVAEEARASSEKRRRSEAKRLDYSNPGEKQSTARPELMETGVRTTRSGKKIPVMTAEEIEHEDVFQVCDGSLADRTLDLARQLKNQVAGEEDGDGSEIDDGSESGLDAPAARIADAVESFEQQLRDEHTSTPSSVAFLGQNGDGKSFLINLLLQVTEVREEEYALNGMTAAGAPKDAKEARLRKHLLDTLEGSMELRRKHNYNMTEAAVKIPGKSSRTPCYMPEDERKEEERILKKIKDSHVCGTAPNRESKRGFMLPSAGEGVSTTKIAVKARRVGFFVLMPVRVPCFPSVSFL